MRKKAEFLWGGALAGAQCEGAFEEGKKGAGMADILPAGPERLKFMNDGTYALAHMDEKHNYPARTAIDFYHHYKEDIKLFADLGLKVLRFSVTWPRIFPEGDEKTPNEDGLRFYDGVIDTCISCGIEPMVTINHFDTPLGLIKKYGGWRNRALIGFFENYCRVLFERYKGKVRYWLPFNEINMILHLPFVGGGLCFEEGENRERVKYQAAHHQLIASALVTKMAHEIYPMNRIGCMLAAGEIYPYSCSPQDAALAQKKNRELYFFSDIQVRGYYPSYASSLFREKGVSLEMEPEDAQILKNTVDFVALSYYSSRCASADPEVSAQKTKGNAFEGVHNPYISESAWGWQIDPDGFRITLNSLYDRYQKPLFVVENGLGARDTVNEAGQVEDDYRIEYLREHIKALKEALKEGNDIIGYCQWSPVDIVSASTGEMEKRYGLIYVDIDNEGKGTGKRIPKKSYYWYKAAIENDCEIL